MSILSAYLSRNYWRYNFSFIKVIKSLLGGFGALWLVVEITSYFSTNWSDKIKNHWGLFLVAGFLWAVYETRPILSKSQRLEGRDVIIEICVKNFFDLKGAYIVGSNTTFDTDITSGLISDKSLQGQFTSKFYDSISHLDKDLDEALKGQACYEITSEKKGKKKQYDIGSVAKITTRNVNTYFVAIASLNSHGVAYSSFENIQDSLSKLWDFIANRGDLEPLIIPILGSGFSRIEATREFIIKEIIKSFIAACATKRFTERLTIVIHPKDYKEFDINLCELNDFLEHHCKFTEFKSSKDIGGGIALS